MKTLKCLVYLALGLLAPRFVLADLVGNYTPDANTLFLLHFDGPAGSSVVTNYGTKGGYFYTVVNSTSGNGTATPTVTTVMLGQPGYVNGATNFNLCLTNPVAGGMAGYDFNGSGAFQGDVSSSTPSPDRLAMTNLNIGNGGQSPFTIEALVRPSTTTPATSQEIVCTDSTQTGRAFQFRIVSGQLQFQFINGTALVISGTIPTTGNDALVANNWYHAAITYDGATATLYWTLLNPTNGAAHVLSTASLALGTTQGATTGPLVIGNENRNSSQEQFQGCIDEVRISSVARGSGQMQFFSPLVSITQNPVSQNVDYNQPVTFSVGASSQFALGYQWRFNSNSIAGATNAVYVITNVAAGNAGYYDCVVTNTIGSAATSSEGRLVVGAANFLANRYSFNTSSTDPTTGLTVTPDSVGGQWGTNFGNATVTGGKLVLDGTTGTYMQLPPNLYNGANATALTFEFWATNGTNPNNVYTFAFGLTNAVSGNIVGFNHAMYCSHNAGGQTASATAGDPQFAQTVSASGNFDGQTVHVAVVMDPPNKMLSIYTNGVLEAANTNFTVNISSLNDVQSWIGRSLWAADPYLNASIDELRIFRGALSSISILQSQVQGPDVPLAGGPAAFLTQPGNVTVPLGQPATFSVASVGYLPITYQWYKNGVPISGATNFSYTYIPPLGDNGSTISCQAANTIGATTYPTNSAGATLNVFLPPTLSWLGTTDGGADNTWNTSSLDWTNDLLGGGIIAFAQTNGVLFDDRSGGGSVDVEQTIIPYNIQVNAASSYQFSSSGGLGALAGPASMVKQNSGTLQIDLTNTLSGPVTISGGVLQIGNNDALGSLGTSVVTNNSQLSLNRSDTALNVANPIHGTGVLSLDGTGAVTLSGNNDFSGATLVNAGILYLTSATGLGAPSAGTTVASGGQLYVTANVNLAEPLSLSGSGDGNGALRKGGAGLTVETGSVALAADATIGLDSGSTLVLSNTVSGPQALTAVGGGVLTLSQNNSFSGGFNLNGSLVNVNASGGLGTAPVTVSGAGRFILGDGVTVANAFHATTVSPGAATGLLMVNDNTNGTITTVSGPLTFDVTPANGGDFQGPLTAGYLNVTGPVTNSVTGVVSSRNGFVRLSGGGNYTLVTLNQGTLSIGANNGLCPNASMTIGGSGGAAFDLNGFNQTLTGLADGAANAELITNSAATLSTLTLNLAAGGSFNGVIAGNLALVENGAGNNLLLNATNTYTGNTTINSGSLELAHPGLAAVSTVTIASGATLQLDFATTNTVGALVLNGVSQASGVYNNINVPTYITGSGSLLVVPPVNTTPTNLVATVSGSSLTLTWPADHTGWRLQSQSSSLSSGLGTNWVDVPGTAAANTYNTTLNPANAAVFYRMVYP